MGAPTPTADDPLLRLLQRYEAQLATFNDGPAAAQQDWDNIAETTWSRTQDEILKRQTGGDLCRGCATGTRSRIEK